MSRKLCKDRDDLTVKIRGRKKKYICSTCGKKSPKTKWCCNPEEIER